jgi:hypothetical protein
MMRDDYAFHSRYPFDHFSPTFTFGSRLAHMFKLCCEWVNEMDVKYLLPHENPLRAQEIIEDVPDLQGLPTQETVAFVWSRLLHIPVTNLTFREKREFLEYQSQKKKKL